MPPNSQTSAVSSEARLQTVRDAVDRAATDADRPAADVTLIAVSKTFDADAIRPVLELGHRDFGENRVQESQDKWPDLKRAFPDTTLHLIGPLQSNKAADAVALFDCIHTVDRPKIARALKKEMDAQGRTPELFVQVNTGEEAQKAGVMPTEVKTFVDMCRDDIGLEIAGLMCIPPIDEEPGVHFAFLRKLAGECGVSGLSMGMSGDYETAIQLGATHIRVGSAIFGPRG